MNRVFLIFIISIFLLTTVLISVFRPKTHKRIVFEDRNFKIELISDESSANKVDNSEIFFDNINSNKTPVNIETPKINITLPEYDKKLKSEVKNQSDKIQQRHGTTQIVTKNEQKKVNSKSLQTTTKVSTNSPTINTNVIQPTQKIKEKQKEITNDKVEKIPKTTEEKSNNFLTEEEEIIAWNKWRSDLQNKLMKESKISAPIGTSFEFSFTVDKFGNISNLKTWSSNPSYTPLAVRVIKPLLLSYQKTVILNFPNGSKRVITNVNGGFTMARSSRYSSPSDYNDYERVVK